METILIVSNSASGRGRADQVVATVTQALAGVATVESRTVQDHSPLPTDVKALIIVGGDGTVRGVVDRYLKQSDAPPPPMIVVSAGTANLLSKHLGYRWKSKTLGQQITTLLKQGITRELDVLDVNGQASLLMCSVGFDAEVVHRLCARRNGPITKASYVRPFFDAIWSFKTWSVEVEVDGQRVFGPGHAMVMIANVPEYGAEFPIVPHAKGDDQLVDVVIVPFVSRTGLFFQAMRTVFQRLVKNAPHFQGRQIVVRGDAPVQVDGEAMDTSPVTVNLLSRRTRFIVPER